MQTFFNPTTPFFDGEGKPMVGARVSFLDVETSTSFISLTDSAGTALPNPLYTGSDGRLRLEGGDGAPAVPCVADGLSYKVVVARRTGVEPVYVGGILQNPGELYETPYIAFVVTAMGGSGVTPDAAILGSIADVRLADKALESVVCTGYYSSGDCPSRVFTWVDSVEPPEDNGINVLRNPDDATGYWLMGTPDSGMWDVRVAGMSTSNETYVNAQRLTALLNYVNSQGTPVPTIYFPAGNWLFEGGFTCASLVMEKGANFKPSDNTSDRTVVVSHLENRGGLFYAYDTSSTASKRVILKVTGLLRSSWLSGTINEFLTANALENVEEIIFDSITGNGGTAATVQGKRILQLCSLPSSITFEDCERYDVTTGILHANILHLVSQLRMGDNYNAKLEDGKVKMRYNTNELVNIGNALVDVLKSVSMPDFAIGESGLEGWKVWNDGTDWDGEFFLLAAKIAAGEMKVNELKCNNVATLSNGAQMKFDTVAMTSSNATIDDTAFGDATKMLLLSSSQSAHKVNVTATPLAGRIIKVCAFTTDINNYQNFAIGVEVNGTGITALHSGTSIYLFATGSGWAIDWTRL